MTNVLRHFTDLSILTPKTAHAIIDYAATLKKIFKAEQNSKTFVDKHWQ